MTTRLVRDESSIEKSTRLLEMSVGERLRKNRAIVEVWTKRCLGHGLAYGLPYGLPVVDVLELVSALL